MDKKTLKRLAETLKNFPLEENIYIMEVCGTHTVEFFRTGVRSLFPKHLHLIDGPGCPVCVTPNEYLDRAIEIGKQYHPIIATFGDMMKVPSSYSSLKEEKAKGMDITVVYSPFDAVEIAAKNPDREVMFVNIGFETTAPGEAQAILEAKERGIKNFSIEPKGCRCGDILRGMALPPDCPLFGRACRPERPVGPCMVSAEGACAAYYTYGGYSKEHSK